jgi:rod shape-determining protein MreC
MKPSPRLKIGIAIFFLITFFFILNFTGFSKDIKNFFYCISLPIQRNFWKFGDKISDFFFGFLQAENLKKENEDLRLKIQKLLQEISFLKELKKENERLRTALEIGLEKDFNLIFANVVGKDVAQDFLLIDKGSRDGVKKDFPVITEQKVLCGKVFEVFDDFSKVQLIWKKGYSFDVKISDSEESEIYEAKGEGDFKMSLNLVPREKELKEGDLIITSAIGGSFPKGLLVGTTQKIEKSDIEPFQRAEINIACDLKGLENLFIIERW